jgi:phosphopantothenoylcysteine decarboxylase/phosphopantothenate--cysteine ligase
MQNTSLIFGKKIMLGVSGSIAAYKSAELVRLLIKAGAQVRVVMTKDALEFITPLTLATLSQHPVYSDFTENLDQGTWVNHVELGMWADVILVAPATANTLSKMASGMCDNLLLAVVLSARCPVVVAPAMDLDMYAHAGTQTNLETLRERGVAVIAAEEGFLASGLQGQGRLAEPAHIVAALDQHFLKSAPLHSLRALVTAGPTHESIDAVRFIGNRSSGKMGFAIAKRLAELGAAVTLVSGPVSLSTPHPAVGRKNIETAEELLAVCLEESATADIIVMSAAVADYRVANQLLGKLKKGDESLVLELEPTVDILAELGRRKSETQILVGFALESDNEIEHARGKLQRKNLDLIVLNSLRDEGAGFGHDTNQITLIDKQNNLVRFELKSKSEVAHDIVEKIIALCAR